MDYKEKTIESNYIYQGKIINVRKDTVELSNQKTAYREIIEHSGGVCALAVTKNRKIFFVRQYRIPFHDYIIELPAGKIEINDHPDQAVIRELHEEVGVIVNTIEKIGLIYSSPGYTNEIIHMYYTDNFSVENNCLDEDEFLDIVMIDVDEAYRMIETNEIVDSKTIILLLRLKDKLKPKIEEKI